MSLGKSRKTHLFGIALWAAIGQVALAHDQTIDLNTTWNFALDPLEMGKQYGWHSVPDDWTGQRWLDVKGWDRVEVPHDFHTDPRFEWTGVAWYRKSVETPNGGRDAVYRLQFDRVASKCEIWVNGKLAGAHHGAYTPFEFDVSQFIRPGRYNHVAIKVDNRRAIGDNPGPRMNAAPKAQVIPWRTFGGILRSASLVVSPAVHVVNQKIDTTPTLPTGPARIRVTAYVRNGSRQDRSVTVSTKLTRLGEAESVVNGQPARSQISVPAESTVPVSLELEVGAESVQLWSPDTPSLYGSKVTVSADDGDESYFHTATFGIRTVETRDGQLLLNGEPIRLAGANRAEGHPDHGGLESAEIVDLDLGLLKRAHLELHRLQHYPPSQEMLDWCDRHGMLIFCEAPSWGLGPEELKDERYRSNFHSQFEEMVKSSWNHPSVIGWSVGNEYHSWTPEGVDWTRTFAALSKQLDPSRPTTFAALGHAPNQKSASMEMRSMHWVDLISINYYMSGENAGKNLDLLHKRWPEKPIFISEYGKRADQATEEERIVHFRDLLQAVRSRDFVIGMAYWSFNDYRSRYPGTNRSGYRPWGVVGSDRTPRELYRAMRMDLSPGQLRIASEDPLEVEVQARKGFPSMTLRNYRLRILDAAGELLAEEPVVTLAPGEVAKVAFEVARAARVQLVRPTGYICAQID